ncbi:MAG: hypothetical protein ABSF38_19795 [Verrucomicrobiota bacterium]|jgi:hypothetical protein
MLELELAQENQPCPDAKPLPQAQRILSVPFNVEPVVPDAGNERRDLKTLLSLMFLVSEVVGPQTAECSPDRQV